MRLLSFTQLLRNFVTTWRLTADDRSLIWNLRTQKDSAQRTQTWTWTLSIILFAVPFNRWCIAVDDSLQTSSSSEQSLSGANCRDVSLIAPLVNGVAGSSASSTHASCKEDTLNTWYEDSVASPKFCVRGGGTGLASYKDRKNKCIPYHPGQHFIYPSMRYCIRPECHSHKIIKWSSLKIDDTGY